jgi:single-strand DNA-binding protein
MGRSFESHVVGGNVGGTPETKTLDSGATVCKFSLATNRKYKDQEYTTWYTIEAWNKLGEICQQYIDKGDFVTVISNRFNAHAFIGNDGEAKVSLQLTASDVHFGGSAQDDTAKAAKPKEEVEELPW